MMEKRQHKGSRLSCARLGKADEVTPGEGRTDRK
jgi:hypothetical protein